MALTLTDLVDVDLSRLATAVSDWKKAVDGLKKAAESARTGMQAKSDSARWAGVNATVTREFVAKTAKEVSDLHSEGNSNYQVLEDGHNELASLQKQLRTAVQVDAPHLGVRVEDIGAGKVPVPQPTSTRTTLLASWVKWDRTRTPIPPSPPHSRLTRPMSWIM
ncbi:hypothetical protein [Streptomyces sp. NPDC053069]|uniref:hypothetical protein n=1 Tax=Streptomyces sp. NPDC053069 TaxID=3365695 RepID=UPI0037D8DA1F